MSFSRKPRPPQCSLASLARVPKVTPSRKNPRSANGYVVSYITSVDETVVGTLAELHHDSSLGVTDRQTDRQT